MPKGAGYPVYISNPGKEGDKLNDTPSSTGNAEVPSELPSKKTSSKQDSYSAVLRSQSGRFTVTHDKLVDKGKSLHKRVPSHIKSIHAESKNGKSTIEILTKSKSGYNKQSTRIKNYNHIVLTGSDYCSSFANDDIQEFK